jgi:hypothetical protein
MKKSYTIPNCDVKIFGDERIRTDVAVSNIENTYAANELHNYIKTQAGSARSTVVMNILQIK